MTNLPSDWCHLLDGYVLEDLTDSETSGFEGHLPQCADCRQELDELSVLKTQIRAAVHSSPERSVVCVSQQQSPLSDRRRHTFVAATISCLSLLVLAWVLNANSSQDPAENSADTTAPAINPLQPDQNETFGNLLVQQEPAERPAQVEMNSGFIGVPLDSGDSNSTIMLVYPSGQQDLVESPPGSGLAPDEESAVAVLTVFEI